MAAGDTDARFKDLLNEFESEHRSHKRALRAHMKKAKAILEAEMEVRHMPISARVKETSKARRTLERRQDDRKQLAGLKQLVEKRASGSWEQYCKEWMMEDKRDEAEPFSSLDQMREAMHDLAGIRISLYFPDDAPKVVDFLKMRFDIVKEPSRKGGLTRDFQKIRKLVELQRQVNEDTATEPPRNSGYFEPIREEFDDLMASSAESRFGGYRATHVVVRLRRQDLDFDEDAKDEAQINIEVQIGSIIMHAWSDIEHNILYKPATSGKPSSDVSRMLGLINGIVATGEVALQQLAAVAAAETKRQAEDESQEALGWEYMTPWLDKYFFEYKKKRVPPKHHWMSTGFLYEILKATNDHKYVKLKDHLESMNPEPEPEERVPIMVMQHFGKDTYPFKDDLPFSPRHHESAAWSARLWATRLVSALNLASYMHLYEPKDNRGSSVFVAMRVRLEQNQSKLKLPSFAEFLDVLHPSKMLRRPDHEERIIDFCKYMLDTPCEILESIFSLLALFDMQC